MMVAVGLKLVSLCLLAALVVIATGAAKPAFASPPPASDVSLDSLPIPRLSGNAWWTVIVRNDPVPGHPTAPAYDVVVRITATANGQEYQQHSATDEPSLGRWEGDSGEWTIPVIQVGESAELIIRPEAFFPRFDQDTPVRLHAVLVEPRYPTRLAGEQRSIETEGWYVRLASGQFRWPGVDASVGVYSANLIPALGTQTTFNVHSVNEFYEYGDRLSVSTRHKSLKQWDVQIKIDLSQGLSFPAGLTPPVGTSFDVESNIWSVGILSGLSGPASIKTWSIPVNVTGVDIPLEHRCLTATVVGATPAFELDQQVRLNDVVTFCLGKRVVSKGAITLFDFFPCVGVTSGPCTGTDTLELIATLQSPTRFLQPEDLVLPVGPDDRITRGGVTVWSTRGQLALKNSQTRLPSSVWSAPFEDLTVTGSDGLNPPGSLTMNLLNNEGKILLTVVTNDTITETADLVTTGYEYPVELVFETMGTYVLTMDIRGTHDTAGQLTDTGVYTFHVGPVAELAVMDGGEASPLAAADQTAYTIHAANNGPDAASAALVTLTGVPEGSNSMLTDGTYRETSCAGGLCEAEWVLGKQPISDPRPARGQTEYPTLTLLAPAGSAAPDITASIANNQDYSVVIDGVTHSTHYYDYIDENNSATITAQPGAGGVPPGTPQGLRSQYYPSPPTALVWWDPVETLNGWPVSHYEVWESAAPCHDPAPGDAVTSYEGTVFREDLTPDELEEARCYRVRAVNAQGVPGYWSEAVTASTGEQTVPRLSIRGGPSVSEGGTVNFTVTAFPAPVEDTVIDYTVTWDGEFRALAGKQVIALNTAETEVSIAVRTVDDQAEEKHGSVTVTLNAGEGYELSSSRSATVRVLDNDRSTVFFTDLLGGATVSEGSGRHNVEVSVSPAPSVPFTIDYTLSETGTATENEDFRISGSGSVRAPVGAEGVTIRVQVLNDGESEGEETLALILSSSDDYKLTSQRSVYTLTITDDDGPRVEFASTETSEEEADETHNVTINLDPAPTSDVTVNYQVGGTATRDADFTMDDYASVAVSAGTTSVDLPVRIKEDTNDESNETVILTLRGGSGYTLGGSETRKHELTIRDDDRASVAFASSETTVGEDAGGTQNVRIDLTPEAPAGGLTLQYQSTGTATRGTNRDYTIEGYGRVTVPAGATQAFIPVAVRGDEENEDDETIVLTLTDRPGHYNVGATKTHTITITDDDVSEVSFEKTEESIRESGGSRRAYITVDPAPRRELTVGYVVGGTVEHDGSDYSISGLTGTYGTVTVPQGSRRVSIPISIANDTEVEGEERLTLTLSAAGTGYEFGEPTGYTLTIEDDDAPVATFATSSGSIYENAEDNTHEVTVNFSRAPESDVAIGYSVGGSATAGEDGDYAALSGSVNVPAGETSATIEVVISDDEDNEGNETVVLRLDNSTEYTVGSRGEYRLTIIDEDHDGATPVASINAPNTSNTDTSCETSEQGLICHPSFNVDNTRAYDRPTSLDYLDCFNSNPRGTGCYGDLPADLDLILQYVGGTATVGEDFVMKGRRADAAVTAVGETFRITARANSARPSGMTSALVQVFKVIRDGKSEGRETVIIRLLNGPGYRLLDGVEYEDFTVYIRD